MDITEQVKQAAVNTFLAQLPHSPDQNGMFRVLMSFKVGNTVKPLLLIGNAHGLIQDGTVTAILNPDEALCAELQPGCHYSRGAMSKRARGRCELVLSIWVDAYKDNAVSCVTQYKSRAARPAQFVVR